MDVPLLIRAKSRLDPFVLSYHQNRETVIYTRHRFAKIGNRSRQKKEKGRKKRLTRERFSSNFASMIQIVDNLNADEFKEPRPLWREVFLFLRKAILRGSLPAGGKLNEQAIAKELGVSRAPVREAIRVLASENFVESIARRGAYVKPFAGKEAEDLVVTMSALQTAAVVEAARNLDDEGEAELHALGAALEEVAGATDAEEIEHSSQWLHRFVVKASRNAFLLHFHEALSTHWGRVRHYGAGRSRGEIAAVVGDHAEIIKALLARDGLRAEGLMREHLARFRDRVSKAAPGEAAADQS
jgi:DNA-binding GntR family transcriptional regulator